MTSKVIFLLKFFCTRPIWGLIPVRIVFGAMLLIHGVTRLIEVHKDVGAFIDELPGEIIFALVLTFAIVEILGGIMAIAGIFTRVAGFLISIVMIISIMTEHITIGLDGGFHVELLLFAIAGMLLMSGGGRFSVDRHIARKLLKKYPSIKHEAYTIAETPYCRWYE